MIADILDTIVSGTATDVRNLQIKLTYVGPQSKPMPTVAFTTFHHLLAMDWFRELRTPSLHYGNDEVNVWTFTITPDEMRDVVGALTKLHLVQWSGDMRAPLLSLMVALKESRIGDVGFEAVVDADDCARVMSAIRAAFESRNPLASHVIAQQQQLIAPDHK